MVDAGWVRSATAPGHEGWTVWEYRDRDGRVTHVQRPSKAARDAYAAAHPGEELGKYLWPGGTPQHLSEIVPVELAVEHMEKPFVLFPEGTRQALAVGALKCCAVYGMNGCRGYRYRDADGASQVVELSFVKGLPVGVLFDADWRTNPNVWDAAEDFGAELRAAGATEVRFLDTPGAVGTEGIDDVLGRMCREPRDEVTHPYGAESALIGQMWKAGTTDIGERPDGDDLIPDLPGVDGEPVDNDARRFAQLVEKATQRERALRLARRAVDAEEAAPAEPVEALSLDDLLAQTFDAPKYRIDGMWPSGGKVMVIAPRKAGKTTLVGNAVRCLLDGDDFLGRFRIDPMTPGHRVALLDFEMNAALVQEWLRDQKIKNTAGLDVFLMRGRGNWDIRDDRVRADWAARLRARDVDVLIVDPLGAVIHPLGIEENSNSEVGRFLTKLGELCEQAGIAELLVMHHAGHFAERSRGASKLLDWPDATWTITRADADTLQSFIRAEGRDVELEETALEFDRATRRLTLGTGNRQTVGGEHAAALLEVLRDTPGLSGNALETALRLKLGIGQPKAQKAIREALNLQKIHRHPGKNRAQRHHAGMACIGDPNCPLADLGLGPIDLI